MNSPINAKRSRLEDDGFSTMVKIPYERTSSQISSRLDDNEISVNGRMENISDKYLSILKAIGENPNREGLRKTPNRAAEAILHFTKGYEETVDGDHFFKVKINFCFVVFLTRFLWISYWII